MQRVVAGGRWQLRSGVIAALRRGPAELPPLLDSLRIEIDGVAFNAGLPDEPLLETCLELAEALADLQAGEAASRSVRLREAGVDLLLTRRGEAVDLALLRRGRPGSAVLGRAEADLAGLAKALAACAKGLLASLEALHPALAEAAPAAALERAAARLRKPARPAPAPAAPPSPFRFEYEGEAGPLRLRVAAADEAGRLYRYRKGPPDLEGLLVEGETALLNTVGTVLARSRLPPFLVLGDLLRLAEAALAGRPAAPLPFGEARAPLQLGDDEAALGEQRWAGAGRALATRAAEAALAFAEAVIGHRPEQRQHEPLAALREQALKVLGRGGELARPDVRGQGPAPAPARPAAQPPIARGSVRRVHFEPLGRTALAFGVDRLQLFGSRVLATGEAGAALLELPDLKVRWAVRGPAVACGPGPVVLHRDPTGRLLLREPATGRARWLRGPDAPELLSALGLVKGPRGRLVVVQERGGAFGGLHLETGAWAWRVAAPLAARASAALLGGVAFSATTTGILHAVEAATGAVRFRLGANLPLKGAPALAAGRLLQLAEGEAEDHLVVLDAASGEVSATHGLGLRTAGPLAVGRGVAATVGRSSGAWAAELLTLRGSRRARAELGLLGRRPALAATPHGLLASGETGEAVLLSPAGEVLWRLAEAAEPVRRELAPRWVRQAALVASERPALVDLASRRVLARLPRVEGLTALEADRQLRVVAADDEGTVLAYRVKGHLAVV